MGNCVDQIAKQVKGGGGGGAAPTPSGPPPPTTPAGPTGGRCKALLIGINYYGQKGELRGCVNDVKTMLSVLDHLGFSQQPGYEAMVLVDDPSWQGAQPPTKRNIMEGFRWLASNASPGDTLFLHYSGHGGQVADRDGDEKDGYDETLIPVDYRQSGQIHDDEIFRYLVAPLPRGVRLTAVMDCCHSGTALDLPYTFTATRHVMEQVLSDPKALAMAMVNSKARMGLLMGVGKGLLKGDLVLDPKKKQQRFTRASSHSVAADVVMFSGCEDRQTSADVKDVGRFGLPPGTGPGGAGGACTNAMAKVLWGSGSLPMVQLLNEMRVELERRHFTQVPQLSSSEPIDLRVMFSLYGPLNPKPQQQPQQLPQHAYPTEGHHRGQTSHHQYQAGHDYAYSDTGYDDHGDYSHHHQPQHHHHQQHYHSQSDYYADHSGYQHHSHHHGGYHRRLRDY